MTFKMFETHNNPILAAIQLVAVTFGFKWGEISGSEILQIITATGGLLIIANQLVLFILNLRKFKKK